MEPQPTNRIFVFVLIGVVIILAIVGVVLFLPRFQAPVGSPEQTTVQQPSTPTPAQPLITYVSTLAAPLKTIPAPAYQGAIQVYSIGTFNQGPYAGKNLVWATFVPSVQNPNWNHITYNYAYYIADAAGTPVVWDPALVHDQGLYPSSGYGEGAPGYIKDFIGLNPALQQSLNFLPAELGSAKEIKTSDHLAMFAAPYSGIVQTDTLAIDGTIATTETGWKIVQQTNPPNSYYVELPFGESLQVAPEPNFVDANDVPQLTWSKGKTAVASYRYGQYAYGWEDCYGGISVDQRNAALVQTGTTVKGDPVFEIDAEKYPKVYECLHEKTKRYVYNDTTKTGSYVDTVSYPDFILSHPMFFWRHPLTGLMAFVRSDVVPAAEKAKPVIYLYPEKPETVHVMVSPIGGLVKTDPEYGNGWIVKATPDGLLSNLKDKKEYPYLFWEGGKDGVVNTPKEGFVVAKSDVAEVLAEKLSAFGLNQREQRDFLDFWVPKLSKAPYYFITFIARAEIDRVSPMTISPKPDTIIRVLMDYKPLTGPISVAPLSIASTPRSGFTVIEWGGIVRN